MYIELVGVASLKIELIFIALLVIEGTTLCNRLLVKLFCVGGSMKKCYACGNTKAESEFNKNRAKRDGLNHECKDCASEKMRKYFRTKKGMVKRIFQNQKTRAKKDITKKVKYTCDELYEWITTRENFGSLYRAWVESGYDRHKVPSADRIDDYGCYEFSNLQLMTWGDNSAKAFKDIVDRVNTKQSETIMACNIKTGNITIYETLEDAKNGTGAASPADISKCCRGELNYIGGSYFCYVKISREKIKKFTHRRKGVK